VCPAADSISEGTHDAQHPLVNMRPVLVQDACFSAVVRAAQSYIRSSSLAFTPPLASFLQSERCFCCSASVTAVWNVYTAFMSLQHAHTFNANRIPGLGDRFAALLCEAMHAGVQRMPTTLLLAYSDVTAPAADKLVGLLHCSARLQHLVISGAAPSQVAKWPTPAPCYASACARLWFPAVT
jgi:hypothetical protein